MGKLRHIGLLFCVVFFPINLYAIETRYISDQCEITLHKAKNPNSEVIARLASGAEVKLLQKAGEDGYAKISTSNNKVAWVLESFLLDEPIGRDQYSKTKTELDKLRVQFDAAVIKRTRALEEELKQLKAISKKPIQIQNENKKLRQTLEQEREQLEVALKENIEFKSIHKDRSWMVTGALISILSLVLGLIITKIPWRRRKSWGEV